MVILGISIKDALIQGCLAGSVGRLWDCRSWGHRAYFKKTDLIQTWFFFFNAKVRCTISWEYFNSWFNQKSWVWHLYLETYSGFSHLNVMALRGVVPLPAPQYLLSVQESLLILMKGFNLVTIFWLRLGGPWRDFIFLEFCDVL